MNQSDVIEDALLDAIDIRPSPDRSPLDPLVRATGEPEVIAATNLLYSFGWPRSLPKFASGVIHQSGFAINDTAFFLLPHRRVGVW